MDEQGLARSPQDRWRTCPLRREDLEPAFLGFTDDFGLLSGALSPRRLADISPHIAPTPRKVPAPSILGRSFPPLPGPHPGALPDPTRCLVTASARTPSRAPSTPESHPTERPKAPDVGLAVRVTNRRRCLAPRPQAVFLPHGVTARQPSGEAGAATETGAPGSRQAPAPRGPRGAQAPPGPSP
jgi:hypothetical protein